MLLLILIFVHTEFPFIGKIYFISSTLSELKRDNTVTLLFGAGTVTSQYRRHAPHVYFFDVE